MNFEDALNVRASDIERPKNPPVGTYRFVVEKVPTLDFGVFDGRFDVCDFQVKALEAQEDVDPAALAEYGQVSSIRQRLRFLFSKEDNAASEKTLFQLRNFLLEHLGVEDNELKVMLNNSVNHQFLGYLGWRPDKNDPNIIYAEIRKTLPVT